MAVVEEEVVVVVVVVVAVVGEEGEVVVVEVVEGVQVLNNRLAGNLEHSSLGYMQNYISASFVFANESWALGQEVVGEEEECR